MKKLFIFAALAAPLFFSCAKEMEKALEQEPENTPVANVAFKASIESLDSPTKADINASNQLVWAAGDKIGVFVNDDGWGVKNQPFVLVGEGGSTNGGFKWDVEPAQDFTNTNATVAFFPWNGTNSSTDNNVYEGTLYFKLPEGYYSYTSGKMLTPLVAQITRTGEDYDQIQFAHAGAAVKVTINNLPVGAKSIGLSVDDKQIRGDWHINPANAGTEAMSLDAAENTALNDVWLNFDPIAAERSYTFLFPVPTLPASSKLSFDIYDKNDIKVWSAGARTKGDVALGRAEVLEMPALDITPYKQFNSVSAEWTVIGTVNGTNWNADIPMVTDGSICIAKGVSFEAGGEFKVRQNKSWEAPNVAYPSSNYVVADAGLYDVIFDPSKGDSEKVKLVASGCPYPSAPVTMGIDGNFSEWASIPGTVAATSSGSAIQQVKAYADDDYVYVYVKRTNEGRFSQLWDDDSGHGAGYYYFYFDLDNDSSTGTYDKNGKWEIGPFLYLFGNTSGTFNTSPSGSANGLTSLSGVVCNGNATSDFVEVEVAFPRENFPTISSQTVRVSVYGNKDAGQVETSFTIPPAAPISISIDGNMSDWAKVPGSSASDITLKVWNDDTNFYLYTSCTPGTREKELWGYKQGYFYYDFDFDNDAATGSYTNEGKNYEAVLCIYPFGGTKYDSSDPSTPVRAVADPVIMSSSDGGFTTSGIVFKPVLTFESSTFTLFEIEFVMPRANFNTQVNAGDVIKIFNWRSKGGGSTTFTYTVQ